MTLIRPWDPLVIFDHEALLYEHMFVGLMDQPSPSHLETDRAWSKESLALLGRARPAVSSSQTRLLPVIPPLVGPVPRRQPAPGNTIVVTGQATAGGSRPGWWW